MGKIVLIIDDSQLVLEMARDALTKSGYTVYVSTNGIEANRLIFSPKKPDLIIIDIMMPLLDGSKKAMLLKEWDFSSKIPILLISSKPESELKEITKEVGADGYIHKPFTPIDIVGAVARCLGDASS